VYQTLSRRSVLQKRYRFARQEAARFISKEVYQTMNPDPVLKRASISFRSLVKFAGPLALFGLTATLAFAQTSSFGTAAQGIATEMIAIAKWVGIILCIVCAFGLMVGGTHAVAKFSGLIIGLVLALFAQPIVAWVQAL
jgi:hypothetical protein